MSKQPSSRDLKQLSAYLDGELSASAAKKLEKRLERDLNLCAALQALRQTRSILHRTPRRRAPHNFSLSPQMVAKRPPLPRLVPALNYASLAVMLLFLLSFFSPIRFGGMVNEAMAPAPMAMEMAEAPAAEEPAMEMATAPAADSAMEESEAAEEEISATEEPAEGVDAEKTYAATEIPLPTMTPLPVRTMPEPQVEPVAPLLSPYQRTLVILLGVFVILSWGVRRATIVKWQKKVK